MLFYDAASSKIRRERFAPFYHHPEVSYAVGVIPTRAGFHITCGENPWKQPTNGVHVGEMMEEYGGGGHRAVGGANPPSLAEAKRLGEEVAVTDQGPPRSAPEARQWKPPRRKSPGPCSRPTPPPLRSFIVVARGGKPFHAKVLRRAVLERGVLELRPGSRTCPAGLRAILEEELPIFSGRLVDERTAADGTRKLLIEFPGRREGE